MSKIVLLINDPRGARAQIVAELRRHLQLEYAKMVGGIDRGEPLFERPLFPRNDPGFPGRLLAVFEALDRLGVDYTAFELLDHQTFEQEKDNLLYRVTTARLRTIIDADKKLSKELERQSQLEEDAE